MTVLRAGSATDVGRVRQSNQDMALDGPDLFAVADGMGGHAGGEVASKVAMEALQAAFAPHRTPGGLRDAVKAANAAVWRRAFVRSELRGMGTTLTAAALVADEDGRDVMVLANVGDSRAYLYSDHQMAQVTADHSLAEEKVRLGELTEAEAAVHPQRHILTRALGVGPEVQADLWELEVHAGDRVLLCSDGLTNEVVDDEIVQVLDAVSDPAEAARALVEVANDHGGNDNITVVVIDVLVADPVPEERAGGVEGAGPFRAEGPLAAATPLLAEPAAAAAETPGAGEDGRPETAASAIAPDAPATEPEPSADDGTEPPAGGTEHLSSATDALAAEGVTGVVPAIGPEARAEAPNAERLVSASGPVPVGSARLGARAPVGTVAGAGGGVPVSAVVEEAEQALGQPEPAGWWARRRERRRRRRAAGIPRRVTLRVVLFLVLVAGVFVGAYYFVRWYANDNWYVTVRHDQLVIYQGRPGGLLWFEPQAVDRTGVKTSDILPTRVAAVRADVQEGSLAGARRYVANLVNEKRDQQKVNSGLPLGTTTTTTTAPGAFGSTVPPVAPATTVPPGATTTVVVP